MFGGDRGGDRLGYPLSMDRRFARRARLGSLLPLLLLLSGADGGLPAAMAETGSPVPTDPRAATRRPDATRTVNWPAFRGWNADGIGDGEPTPAEWDLETGAGILWQREIPGLAHSSPIVWGNLVIVTTAVAVGHEQFLKVGLSGEGWTVDEDVVHSWRVLAFDKRSGEPVWDYEAGHSLPLSRRHFKATQANSTPATDGEHVVAVFPTAGLVCLDLQGRPLWKRSLGPLATGNRNLDWGFASSPILYGDTVILQVDTRDDPHISAWDLATGDPVWSTPRPVSSSWSTPTIVTGPRGDELVASGTTVIGYDPTTGEELWSVHPNSLRSVATPVARDGIVFVTGGTNPIMPVYAIRAGLRDHVEYSAGLEHPGLAWARATGGSYLATPLLYRDLLYVVHHAGRISVYRAGDGAIVYQERFSRRSVFSASPVASEGRIYMPTENGLLFVVAAGPSFREIDVHDFGEPLMATPAISEGVLYVRSRSRLVAIGRHGASGPDSEPPRR